MKSVDLMTVEQSDDTAAHSDERLDSELLENKQTESQLTAPGLPGVMCQSAGSAVMDQSTCSDVSYVKCERPSSSFHRTESGSDFNRVVPSDFRYNKLSSWVLDVVSWTEVGGI